MPTISPDYQQKGVWNPYYNIDPTTDRAVTREIAKEYDIERGAFLRYKMFIQKILRLVGI